MIKFELRPFDVLFFGDGRPFNFGVFEVSSLFPPLATTLAGSICNKIYVEKIIDINKIIKYIYGPFLEKGAEILFPKPLDVLKRKDGKIYNGELLKNSTLINSHHTDMSESLRNLLWLKGDIGKLDVSEGFIKLRGLRKWIENQCISEDDIIIGRDDIRNNIFDYETRIGIKIDYSKNVATEEGIFRVNFVRLKEDVKIIFFVEFDYDNDHLKKSTLDSEDRILDFFNNSVRVLKLGGEMRCVYYECKREDFNYFGEPPEVKEGEIIKILYLTHGFLEENDSYEILCASTKLMNLGMHSTNYGVKLKRGISAGSVIYAKVIDSHKLKELWLKPKNDDFIGSNLRIYAKYKGGW